jgi:hypothetical protein
VTPSCARCGLEFGGETCPNCGLRVSLRDERNPVKKYFDTLWRILTRPTDFFRSMPTRGGIAGPLAFALVTHWIGSAISFVWKAMLGGAIGQHFKSFQKMFQDVAEIDYPGRSAQVIEMQERVAHWMWGAGSVILDPFLTLFSILFTSLLVFIGARILVPTGHDGAPTEVSFESALRIVAFGMTPAILAALPLFGGVISYICVIVVTVIAAREVYRISTGRAIVVALFPKLLFLGIIALGVFFFFVMIFKLFASLV